MSFTHAIVTGARGFLGSRLCPALLARGIRVTSLDRQDEGPSGCDHRPGSLADTLPQALAGLRDAAPGRTVLFHLAGMADARACADAPDLAREANVDLVRSVMDEAVAHGVACVVFPSTGYVYGEDGTFDESAAANPVSEYAKTKLAAERLLMQYADRCAVRIARLSNVYGPGSSPATVVGRLLDQIRRGKELEVWNPAPVRDFIHVDDVAEGMVRIASIPGSAPVAVNLSTGIGTSIGEVVELASCITGQPWRLPASGESRPSVMVLDNTRLREMTNWTPQVLMTIGLRGCFTAIRPMGHTANQ